MAGCTHHASSARTDPSQWLASAGFSELALPSTAFGPGTLVTSVTGHGFAHPLRLAHICDPAFTATFPPQVNAAASREMARQISGGLELRGNALDRFRLGAGASHVESISLNLRNVRIEHHSHERLQEISSGLGPACRELLGRFRQQGIARQTLQALRADFEYSVTFKTTASAELRGSILRSLAAEIGGDISRTGESRVVGEGLYYGVVLTDV
jgi:hypothetical protein